MKRFTLYFTACALVVTGVAMVITQTVQCGFQRTLKPERPVIKGFSHGDQTLFNMVDFYPFKTPYRP